MLMMVMIMMKKTMSEPNTISAGLSLRRSLEGGGDHWSSQIKDPNKGFRDHNDEDGGDQDMVMVLMMTMVVMVMVMVV